MFHSEISDVQVNRFIMVRSVERMVISDLPLLPGIALTDKSER